MGYYKTQDDMSVPTVSFFVRTHTVTHTNTHSNLILMSAMQIMATKDSNSMKLQMATPSQQELNLSKFKTGSAETKPHQSDSFITLCQMQPP